MSEGQVGVIYPIYGEVAREELGINATKVVWVDPSKVDAGWLKRMREAGRVIESESASEPHCGPVAADLPPSDCLVCGSPETGYKAHHEALMPSCTAVEHKFNGSE